MQKLDYYNFAEQDYNAAINLHNSLDGSPLNAICVLAQTAIEKYLKHIITTSVDLNKLDADGFMHYERIIESHSLRDIYNFIYNSEVLFVVEESSLIRQADGFYYDANYPGKSSFNVSMNDIEVSIKCLTLIKIAVDSYINKRR